MSDNKRKKEDQLIKRTVYQLIKQLYPDAIKSTVIIQEDGPGTIYVKANVQIMDMPKDLDITITFTNED